MSDDRAAAAVALTLIGQPLELEEASAPAELMDDDGDAVMTQQLAKTGNSTSSSNSNSNSDSDSDSQSSSGSHSSGSSSNSAAPASLLAQVTIPSLECSLTC